MRHLLVLALAVATLLPAAARADDAVTPAPAIAQCIRDNAPKVEAAVADLNQAVDFLVTDVCAEQVASQQAAQQKRSSERMLAQWQKMCATEPAEKKDLEASYCTMAKAGFATDAANDEDGGSYTIYGITAWSKPADAVALASRLLLDLRLSHMKGK